MGRGNCHQTSWHLRFFGSERLRRGIFSKRAKVAIRTCATMEKPLEILYLSETNEVWKNLPCSGTKGRK
jgi:hypothetical protein